MSGFFDQKEVTGNFEPEIIIGCMEVMGSRHFGVIKRKWDSDKREWIEKFTPLDPLYTAEGVRALMEVNFDGPGWRRRVRISNKVEK